MGRSISSANLSASVEAADSCSGEISMRSFLLLERRRIMTRMNVNSSDGVSLPSAQPHHLFLLRAHSVVETHEEGVRLQRDRLHHLQPPSWPWTSISKNVLQMEPRYVTFGDWLFFTQHNFLDIHPICYLNQVLSFYS